VEEKVSVWHVQSRVGILYHLVGVHGVDVAVDDVGDVGILSKRSHCAATGPVAVHILDQDVLCWGLDRDTLVLDRMLAYEVPLGRG
jgi:hypothetical protein